MCHLRYKLGIFLFHRKVMFRSLDIQVFVFLTIPWFTKSVRSWWVLVHETGCIFLNHNSLNHQTWPIDRHKEGQYIYEISWTIWRTEAKLQTLFNSATCSNYSITDYVKPPVFHFYEMMNTGELKMVNIKY